MTSVPLPQPTMPTMEQYHQPPVYRQEDRCFRRARCHDSAKSLDCLRQLFRRRRFAAIVSRQPWNVTTTSRNWSTCFTAAKTSITPVDSINSMPYSGPLSPLLRTFSRLWDFLITWDFRIMSSNIVSSLNLHAVLIVCSNKYGITKHSYLPLVVICYMFYVTI